MESFTPLILATHEYQPFRGGVATYVREAAAAGVEQGYRLEIWTADYGREFSADSSMVLPLHGKSFQGPEVVRFPSNGRLTPAGLGAMAWGWWRERRRLRAGRIVLMSVGAQMVFFWFALLGVVAARRTFCFFHGSEVLRFARGPVWRWLARRFYARAGGFGACSEYTARIARESGLLPPGAEVVVARCALPEAFVTRPVPPAGGEDGSWRVLTVARLHPRKGQREVARALARLPAALRSRVVYQVVGVGEPSYRAEVERACREGGVRCEFLGAVDDAALGEVYANCTLYAQASTTLPRSVEGFGITFLEAGFYGKPAAAFQSGGVAEAVLDGRTGLLAPEGDVDGLSVAIGKLLEDPELRARLGAAAHDYALSLRWEDAAHALFEAAIGATG